MVWRWRIISFIEPLILYWVVFLPVWGAGFAPEAVAGAVEYVPFVPMAELGRIFTYNVPALALVWYLLARSRSVSLGDLAPRRRDLGCFLLAFPGLLVLGSLVALGASLFPELPSPLIGAPRGPAAFLVMALSALSTGYLEESYFRFYLFTRFKEGGVGPVKGLLCSSVLFALCHLYEGPLGVLNAFLAGAFLFALFARRRSLHGLAWAHGGYNAFVYIWTALSL
ncbi:caax amino protease family [Treponema primitia ZAS-2]|uniref:Caax amino protease family n=1 Tax=Treponema primitia (strain ATCC BAA-887 / DSM 12427 / ZAS-2) TaxID=545694 RepID=F5YIZ0_TREPZ|nr:CPBP family intramembrane glutamic endopeptidase [Treponema primitia]AEF86999.1 caax amino protease family [Treponema primitia ZAS-2]